MSNTTPDNLQPLGELAAVVATAVATALAWLLGAKKQPEVEPSNVNNIVIAENDKLRDHLMIVLERQRTASEAITSRIEERIRELTDKVSRLREDNHRLEIDLVRVQERLNLPKSRSHHTSS